MPICVLRRCSLSVDMLVPMRERLRGREDKGVRERKG
jgi:hypothetical protein